MRNGDGQSQTLGRFCVGKGRSWSSGGLVWGRQGRKRGGCYGAPFIPIFDKREFRYKERVSDKTKNWMTKKNKLD